MKHTQMELYRSRLTHRTGNPQTTLYLLTPLQHRRLVRLGYLDQIAEKSVFDLHEHGIGLYAYLPDLEPNCHALFKLAGLEGQLDGAVPQSYFELEHTQWRLERNPFNRPHWWYRKEGDLMGEAIWDSDLRHHAAARIASLLVLACQLSEDKDPEWTLRTELAEHRISIPVEVESGDISTGCPKGELELESTSFLAYTYLIASHIREAAYATLFKEVTQ